MAAITLGKYSFNGLSRDVFLLSKDIHFPSTVIHTEPEMSGLHRTVGSENDYLSQLKTTSSLLKQSDINIKSQDGSSITSLTLLQNVRAKFSLLL